MKRKVLLILILILSLLCGCYRNGVVLDPVAEIYESRHQRDYISSRIFNIYKMETNNAIYEVEIMDGVDLVRAQEIINAMEDLIDNIVSYNKELFVTKPTIVVTNYDIQTGLDIIEAYFINNTVVTMFEMLDSYDLVSCIIGAMSSISDPWVLYGIAGSVLGVKPDEDQLKNYYNNPDNLETLDLFGTRFFCSLNKEDSVYAKETAIALYSYIENKYDISSVISFDSGNQTKVTSSMKNEWLDSIGIVHEYDSKYDGMFNGYKFVKKANYDIVIISSFAEYRIMMQEDKKCLLSSIENLELFLYKNLMGVAELKSILSQSKYYDQLRVTDRIIYNINESAYLRRVGTDMRSGIVYLHAPYIEYAHIHETLHSFFTSFIVQKNYDLFTYLQEGLACYLDSAVTNYYTYMSNIKNDESFDERHAISVLIHENSCNGETFKYYCDNSKILERNFMDYYASHGGEIGPLEDFNRSLYADALAYATLKTYDHDLEKQYMYPLYESFVAYLVNTYSLDQVIHANIDCDSFEEIFGKSEEIMINEWKTYLLEG